MHAEGPNALREGQLLAWGESKPALAKPASAAPGRAFLPRVPNASYDARRCDTERSWLDNLVDHICARPVVDVRGAQICQQGRRYSPCSISPTSILVGHRARFQGVFLQQTPYLMGCSDLFYRLAIFNARETCSNLDSRGLVASGIVYGSCAGGRKASWPTLTHSRC